MEVKEVYGGYRVDTEGNVYSKRTGRKMSPHDNGRGYLIVTLTIDGERKVKAVHRLVAEAFVPNPDPDNLLEVDHIDGNKLNNKPHNLRWITRGGNIEHAYRLKVRSAKGESNAKCKTDVKTVKEICELISQGMKSSKIRDLGYDYDLVRSIKSAKNWRHISKDYFDLAIDL